MRRRCLLAVAAAAALLAGVAPGVAEAGDPIMPLSELRPGMRCTALLRDPRDGDPSFDVEIVDVVSGDASANDGPRILVRVSGPAIDETGVGPGFSGSPIYCRDGAGTARNAGAISESIGEYGGKTVLATPIEEILANPPEAPARRGRSAPRASRIGTRAAARRAAHRLRAQPRARAARSPRRARRRAGPCSPRPRCRSRPSPPQPPRPGLVAERRLLVRRSRASARSAPSPTSTATACGASATRSRTAACARCCCRTPTSTP